MSDAQVDVLALSETWSDDTISDHEIFPIGSGVSLIRMDKNHHGGRVTFVGSDQLCF